MIRYRYLVRYNLISNLDLDNKFILKFYHYENQKNFIYMEYMIFYMKYWALLTSIQSFMITTNKIRELIGRYNNDFQG